MSAMGWPGATASGTKPGADGVGSEARTSRLYRIAELIARYRPEADGKKWRVWDSERHERLAAEYDDEAHARAGCRLAAALDIHALFDERPGR